MPKGQTFTSWANDKRLTDRVNKRFYQRMAKWSTEPDKLGRVLLHKLVGNTIPVKTAVNRDEAYTFDGDLSEVGEGTEEAALVSPDFYAKRESRVKIYRVGLQVTREGYNDDKNIDGFIDKHTPMLSDFANLHIERNFVNTFVNQAFEFRRERDGFRLPGDVTPLVGTTHRTANGALYANTFQTHQALSESAIAEAIGMYGTMLDNSGNIMPLRVTKWALLVSSSLYMVARQIVRSTASLTAGSNAGVSNLLADDDIVVVSSPYMTDETQWGLFPIRGDDAEYGLDVIMREVPWLDKVVKQDPYLVKWIVSTRYTLSAGDPRALFQTRAGQ